MATYYETKPIKKKSKKAKSVKNHTVSRTTISARCYICNSKVGVTRNWSATDDIEEDFEDDFEIHLKIKPCLTCDEKKEKQLKQAEEIMDSFGMLIEKHLEKQEKELEEDLPHEGELKIP